MSETPSWNENFWLEAGDNPWQRRLRRHQGWWRETHLKCAPGPKRGGGRLVVSMLPESVGLASNLWSEEARAAAQEAQAALRAERRPGIIEPDRLRRNLLSSQPLCFNLFGYLGKHPQDLLAWVQSMDPLALKISETHLEWAPRVGTIGGSAFDAFISYERSDGQAFLGVEVKYAEDLKRSQTGPAAEKWRTAMAAVGGWRDDAETELDVTGFRQFWYNTLLAQVVLRDHHFVAGRSLVVACSEDHSARKAVDTVSACLQNEHFLAFSAIEEVVGLVSGHEGWKETFATRYLDLSRSD